MSGKIKIGISQGDMNGIGYELILKALMENKLAELCTPIIYGSAKAAAYHRKTLQLPESPIQRINSAKDALEGKSYIINCLSDDIRIELGKATTHSGECAVLCLEHATQDLKNGLIDALVTAPLNKSVVQSENFKFPGHTEYLMSQFNSKEVLMFLVNPLMRIGVVTGHIPVSAISSSLTKEKILQKLRIMNQSLRKDFGIRKPKIAVLGLNPHCGDDGLIGNEEQKIIIPAIEAAKEENIIANGPFPADGFFGSASYTKFDGVLAMYHDQGLAPFKALDVEHGVNYTAGLPVIRTSPDHGTAFEIAGQNIADISSFLESIYMAIDIHKNRKLYDEINKNPLQTSSNEHKKSFNNPE